MNERTKALLEQAGVRYVTVPNDTVYEKFAELLIQECIEVMVCHDYHGEWLGKKIKEHFGVEA